MKPDKNFRLSKKTKTLISLISFRSKEDRNDFKRAMIEAELCSKIVPKSKKDKNEKQVR